MAGKARVHELAKELGVTSKEVLARLSEQGEFVKSASSTVEAPVARRLRESFGGAKPAAEKATADGNGAPAKTAAAAKAPAAAEGSRNQTRGGQTGGTGTCGARGARGPRAGGHGRAGFRTRTARPDTRSTAGRPKPQTRAAHPARRKQPVLLGAAGRAGDSAAAGTSTRRPSARRRPASRRHAGQHAAPSTRWCPRPATAGRRPPARGRRRSRARRWWRRTSRRRRWRR